MKKQYLKPIFKSYNQKQLMLLPPSLDELIEPGHPVRIVDEVIDNVDDTSLLRQYKGGGTSSYHPRMLQPRVWAQLGSNQRPPDYECI
jgi:transposase